MFVPLCVCVLHKHTLGAQKYSVYFSYEMPSAARKAKSIYLGILSFVEGALKSYPYLDTVPE